MVKHLRPTSGPRTGAGLLDKTTLILLGLMLFAALLVFTMMPRVSRGEATQKAACTAAILLPLGLLVLGLRGRRHIFVQWSLRQTPLRRLAGYIIYGGAAAACGFTLFQIPLAIGASRVGVSADQLDILLAREDAVMARIRVGLVIQVAFCAALVLDVLYLYRRHCDRRRDDALPIAPVSGPGQNDGPA